MKYPFLKKDVYETWDEAFQALAPTVRQQSIRVADYTRVIFVQACVMAYGHKTVVGKEQIVGEYADVAYQCGLYHQLGKAMLPTEYQLWKKNFTEEETAAYRTYTTVGRQLVAELQMRGSRRLYRGHRGEIPTQNTPFQMVRQSCEQHMERWNGSGYPRGRARDEITPIAQIVGLAKELDRLASEIVSEDPFSETMEYLMSRAGTDFSSDLIAVLIQAKDPCREVFERYIQYTHAIPHTVPLVEKDHARPMGLRYLPMVDALSRQPTAYEAGAWFGGMEGYPSERLESVEEIEPRLVRLGIVAEMAFYFLYEASDTLLRMRTCGLDEDVIVLPMLPSFYTCKSQLERFRQLWKEQPIDRSKLILTVPQSVLIHAKRETVDQIRRYIRNGVALMLDGWSPEALPMESWEPMGFTHVRPSSELYLTHKGAELFASLRQKGMTLYAQPTDTEDVLKWLAACGVRYIPDIAAVPADEDTMIHRAMVRKYNHG